MEALAAFDCRHSSSQHSAGQCHLFSSLVEDIMFPLSAYVHKL